MNPSRPNRILIIDSDPDSSDLIGRQVLVPLGYQVSIASDVAAAIKQAVQFQPDVILAEMSLPGLSGKDLLVAFSSQGINTPVIVMAEKGKELELVQTFRLGAVDYLMRPLREAELVSAVERTIKQGQEARERQRLDQQLKAANAELQLRLRDLTAIFSVGRAVISTTDQRLLFDKIVEAVVSVSQADASWLTLKDEKTNQFLLASSRGLPDAWAKRVNQPLDDGVSSLVAMSSETLSMHGEPMKKFKLSALGLSAIVVPVKVQKETIGLITVVRKKDIAFTAHEQSLLEAIADYASISLVNSRLFRALSETADSAQAGEKRKNEMLQHLRQEVQAILQSGVYPLELMLAEKMGSLTEDQKNALSTVQLALKKVAFLVSQQMTQPKQ